MILNLFAYVIIPIYTILFAWNTNWLDSNFSVIGNLEDKQLTFLIWGVLIGSYFFYVGQKIIKFIPNSHHEHRISIVSLVLLILAVTTPYLPETLPFQSSLHVVFAFSASVFLLLILYLMVYHLYLENKQSYKPYLIALIVITIISAILFSIAGIISSALEIFFILTCSVLVRLLYQKVINQSLQTN